MAEIVILYQKKMYFSFLRFLKRNHYMDHLIFGHPRNSILNHNITDGPQTESVRANRGLAVRKPAEKCVIFDLVMRFSLIN